jgi:predicted lipoprotein with Yx(FWY)xxD motif
MTKLITSSIAIVAALALGACGGGSSGGAASAPGSAASPAAGGGGAATVSVKQVGGVRDVLVGADGMALYTPEQEAGGKIVCTGSCLSIWKPLTPMGGRPTAKGDAGRLAVLERPDGTRQVTANGKPLYTFAEDAPGKVTGNGFSDAFGGRHFTWHAVVAGGRVAASSAGGSSGSGGSGGSGGGGGYSGGSGY